MPSRVLVAEDDAATSKIMQSILVELFDEVVVVEDGLQAVSHFNDNLHSNPFNLVLLDIMMPVKDGQQPLKEMRDAEDVADIKPSDRARIVMTTSVEDAKSVMQSFREQCDGYLIKPVKAEQIKEVLKDLHFLDD